MDPQKVESVLNLIGLAIQIGQPLVLAIIGALKPSGLTDDEITQVMLRLAADAHALRLRREEMAKPSDPG